MRFPQFVIRLPDWVDAHLPAAEPIYPDVESRMRLVMELARLNVENETGGPFAAAVFEQESGRLVAPGVNMVMPSNCSIVHAEMVALALAQQVIGSHDLGGEGLTACDLFASTEPCAMCFGAIPWSGVRRLVCGARDEDARAIGFDEGPKLPDWVDALEARGIAVVHDVLRDEAVAILRHYQESGGIIYNGRREA